MKKINTHSFTLVLSGVNDETDNLEDNLFEAGCDDSLINFRNGTVYLEFDREALTFEEAVISAIKQVEGSTLSATVINVAPDDYVTESEMAKRLHVKRQTVSLWFKRERRIESAFPSPMMKLTEKSPLWRWYEVVRWLYQQKMISDATIIHNAKFIENLNIALLERNIDAKHYRAELLKKIT